MLVKPVLQFSIYVACTVVFVRGFIFEEMKKVIIERLPFGDEYVAKFMYCPLCFGFWVGLIGYVLFTSVYVTAFDNVFLDSVGFGLLTSVASGVVNSIIKDL